MKKLLGIVVLGLLWCNVGFANIYEYGKCYPAVKTRVEDNNKKETTTHDSWEYYNKNGTWDDITYTINLAAGIVTVSYIQNEEKFEETLKKFEERTGKKFNAARIKQRNYQIITLTPKLINAKAIEKQLESEIFIDLESATIDDKTIFRITDSSVKYKIICEENSMSASQDEGEPSGASGTAFFINNKGNLLTNNHVVEGCKSQKINYFNKEYDVKIIATDKTLDLALLKSEVRSKSFISFSKDEPKKRQPIIIAGYPLGKGLSDDLKINDGRISSLKGFENNSNQITVDIAINPGNSGGPIINQNGQLTAIAVAGMGKDVTEGINFGIKSSAAANFLKSNKISPSKGYMNFSMTDDKLVRLLEESTVYTFCN